MIFAGSGRAVLVDSCVRAGSDIGVVVVVAATAGIAGANAKLPPAKMAIFREMLARKPLSFEL